MNRSCRRRLLRREEQKAPAPRFFSNVNPSTTRPGRTNAKHRIKTFTPRAVSMAETQREGVLRKAIFGRWVILPILLSIVFAALFFPVVNKQYAPRLAVLFTVIGVCVIWVVYLVRAYIFTRPGFTGDDE